MTEKKSRAKKKPFLSQLLTQAKKSKVLQKLEKNILTQSKKTIPMSKLFAGKKATQESLLLGLKKLGIATRSEVDALKTRIQTLEHQLKTATAQEPEEGATSSTPPYRPPSSHSETTESAAH